MQMATALKLLQSPLKGTSGNSLFARSLRYFRAQSVIYTA